MKKNNCVHSFFLSLCVLVLFVVLCSYKSESKRKKPLDEIEKYIIHVDPREDGSCDMRYEISWRVLDSTSEGPLEWVKIGIPNYHADEIKKTSSNISDIAYSSDEGAFIRIDFANSYDAGDIVNFSFSFHQSYLYTLDETSCYYDFVPGWFDEISVRLIQVYWNSNGVQTNNSNSHTDSNTSTTYYLWEKSLSQGEKMHVKVSYKTSFFPTIDSKKQYTDASISTGQLIFRILFVFFLVGFFIIFIKILMRNQDPYMHTRGFCGNYYYFYPGMHHHYYRRGVDKLGNIIIDPTLNTGGSNGVGSHGGSCACACACACAGGGRAGCSRKDFYSTKINYQQLKKVIENDIKKEENV
jgi:hypothetical protein